jgi:hypothetical protein
MFLLFFLACAPKVVMTEPLSGDLVDGHYIVVTDHGEVYDCKSRPDGKKWDPLCILVGFRHSAPAGTDGAAPVGTAPAATPPADQ